MRKNKDDKTNYEKSPCHTHKLGEGRLWAESLCPHSLFTLFGLLTLMIWFRVDVGAMLVLLGFSICSCNDCEEK